MRRCQRTGLLSASMKHGELMNGLLAVGLLATGCTTLAPGSDTATSEWDDGGPMTDGGGSITQPDSAIDGGRGVEPDVGTTDGGGADGEVADGASPDAGMSDAGCALDSACSDPVGGRCTATGACACPSPTMLQDGACTMFPSDGSEGPFHPMSDTVLSAGIHQFTWVTIPAGVTVTTSGAGVLEIRAGGDVVIEGTIDLSGGDGAAGLASVRSASLGGGGGATAAPIPSPTGSIFFCPIGGPGGRRGSGGLDQRGEDGRGISGRYGLGGLFGGGGGGAFAVSTYSCAGSVGGGGAGAGGGGPAGGGGGGARITYRGGAGGGPVPAPGGLPGMPGEGGVAGGAPYDGSAGGTSCGGGGSIGTMAAGDLAIASTFITGSGGGGGGVSTYDHAGGGGGGGGGALRIATTRRLEITESGVLLANGGAGGDGRTSSEGGGGGGSGGVIFLAAPDVRIAGIVHARGGAGGCGVNGGGLGRIRLSVRSTYCDIGVGSFAPQLRSDCNPADEAGYAHLAEWPE